MNISDQQKRNLEYFRNKVCTVITPAINRTFDEKTSIDYFVGKITKIDEVGIWYEHIQSKCLNFVFYNNLISIAEEKMLSSDDDQKNKLLNMALLPTATPQPTYSLPEPTPVKKVITTEQLRKESSPPTDIDALKKLLGS